MPDSGWTQSFLYAEVNRIGEAYTKKEISLDMLTSIFTKYVRVFLRENPNFSPVEIVLSDGIRIKFTLKNYGLEIDRMRSGDTEIDVEVKQPEWIDPIIQPVPYERSPRDRALNNFREEPDKYDLTRYTTRSDDGGAVTELESKLRAVALVYSVNKDLQGCCEMAAQAINEFFSNMPGPRQRDTILWILQDDIAVTFSRDSLGRMKWEADLESRREITGPVDQNAAERVWR